MNLDSLNKWLTLLANFGVVAGLILLAIEVRQNQSVLEQNQEIMSRQYELQVVDGRQAIADSSDEFRLLVGENDEVATIWLAGLRGEEQTEAELFRFRSLCRLRIWNNAIAFRRLKVIGSDEEARDLAALTRTDIDCWRGFSSCWADSEAVLRRWEPDFVESVFATESSERLGLPIASANIGNCAPAE